MNSLYNKLMAEKGAPRAANAPNQTQMRGAPMSLRSAMQKYAVGGGVGSPPPSASDINSFVQANIENPQAILQAAQRYGVSMDALADATGYSSAQIDDYFGNAGLGSFNARPAPVVEGSGFFNQTPIPPVMPSERLNIPPQPADIPLTFMPNEGLNEPEVNFKSFVPEYFEKASNSVETENPSMFSPDPNPSLTIPDRIKGGNPINPNAGIPLELLKKLAERANDPFSSQITQQDQIMKLLQSLGMK
jgi:hypothetical protein